MEDQLLVVNCGSSSLKLAVFDQDRRKLVSVLAERLNTDEASARISGTAETIPLPDNGSYERVLAALVEALKTRGILCRAPVAIGHRVVHGGETFRGAALIDDQVVAAIDHCASLAPLHNPVNLAGIAATRALYPEVPQVAVFDTAFHQTLPPKAFRYALPEAYYRDWAVRRYGFHGTSHYFMAQEAARLLARTPDTTSIISAHLGNGCSVAAIRNGRSVDTSMGLTPLEGLVMGTRSGDVDPSLFDYLAGKGLSAAEVHEALNKQSGLLGLSGESNDMRTLCDLAEQGHSGAALAIDVFCFRLARYLGAMTASLTALDALVFTGGIGENSARVRQQTVEHLSLLGITLDSVANARNGADTEGRINAAESRYPVLVIPTNEERVIAEEALRLARSTQSPSTD